VRLNQLPSSVVRAQGVRLTTYWELMTLFPHRWQRLHCTTLLLVFMNHSRTKIFLQLFF